MVDISDFLKQYIPEHRGPLVTTTGVTVGEHAGTEFYTIGQRHIDADFQFPKKGAAARKPFYVAEKNAATNTIVVAEGSENPALYKKEIVLTGVHFVNAVPAKKVSVFARVRYRQPLAKAILQWKVKSKKLKVSKKKKETDFSLSTFSFQLVFDKPQKFIAPGQSAVFYDKNGVMLGGGVII